MQLPLVVILDNQNKEHSQLLLDIKQGNPVKEVRLLPSVINQDKQDKEKDQ
jgi:hypothetical protein